MVFVGFPDGGNIGSTVSCRGETHRELNKTKTIDKMTLKVSSISMRDIYKSFMWKSSKLEQALESDINL